MLKHRPMDCVKEGNTSERTDRLAGQNNKDRLGSG